MIHSQSCHLRSYVGGNVEDGNYRFVSQAKRCQNRQCYCHGVVELNNGVTIWTEERVYLFTKHDQTFSCTALTRIVIGRRGSLYRYFYFIHDKDRVALMHFILCGRVLCADS